MLLNGALDYVPHRAALQQGIGDGRQAGVDGSARARRGRSGCLRAADCTSARATLPLVGRASGKKPQCRVGG